MLAVRSVADPRRAARCVRRPSAGDAVVTGGHVLTTVSRIGVVEYWPRSAELEDVLAVLYAPLVRAALDAGGASVKLGQCDAGANRTLPRRCDLVVSLAAPRWGVWGFEITCPLIARRTGDAAEGVLASVMLTADRRAADIHAAELGAAGHDAVAAAVRRVGSAPLLQEGFGGGLARAPRAARWLADVERGIAWALLDDRPRQIAEGVMLAADGARGPARAGPPGRP